MTSHSDSNPPALGQLPLPTGVALLAVVIVGAMMAPMVAAHDAGTYTVLIKETGPTPNNPELYYNDSVWWYNVDSSENVTHRIVWDSDGDGLYNGTADWDSGNLSSECETDANGTKLDENCQVTYEIPFNGTWGAGIYNYSVIRSDGVVNNGTITVYADTHVEEGNAPPIGGYEFGNDDETQEPQTEDEDPKKNWLLIIAGASGLLSLMLIGLLIVMGPGENLLTPDDDVALMDSAGMDGAVGRDSDIDEIAEEE